MTKLVVADEEVVTGEIMLAFVLVKLAGVRKMLTEWQRATEGVGMGV